MQRGNLSESEEFFLLEMFFSSNTSGNAFQYHFFFCPASRSCKHILYCGGKILWGVAPSTFAFDFGRTQMNSVGESVHMNALLTCELRHLLWPQYGEVPYASGVAPSIFSGTYGQTAYASYRKAPQIHLCPPKTKYVFAPFAWK